MVRYDPFRANAAELPTLRRWVFLGLIASLALHAGLFFYFRAQQVEGFSLAENKVPAAKPFHIKQVSIPAIPEDTKLSIPEKPHTVANLTLPQDSPQVQEVRMAPQVSDLSKTVFNEKPRVDPSANLAKVGAASRNEIDKELNAITQNFIKEGPHSPRQPLIRAPSGRAGSGPGAGDANLSIPGLASVDDLLSQAGGLKAGDRAAMPGGALFEYDRYELLPDALDALRKLAQIIKSNPKATFSIEGHSDSFGSPEYNVKLSEMRAESVKNWLVQALNISPDRIQTRGFGNSKPIIPADKSKEEQAPNRRVEIVVKTNRQ